MTTPNRRRAVRQITCVPAGVATAEKDRIGLIRDVSVQGALVFSKSRFTVDDVLRLSICVDMNDAHNLDVKGRIIRVERLLEGFWAFKLGVVFEPPREDLASIFKELADRQARLFGSAAP